ncbi:hypothetical protein FGU71_02155 [Erythrobacter insulae]|uniref:Uncharacterized protein n=1 Tax=Erythrobacter insulae TaxID=2584124 RepID=A0A547P9M5_9SPHN|nr:hypothetical protein [Erythrobacter insulae]TRD10787.1 hypothetical protein FGU71_02155 [Erythrobacter insulae]
MNAPIGTDEAIARQRFMIMNAVRIGSLGALIVGLAIARSVIDLPYPLGVALAVGGLLAFYFGPRALARKWKSSAGDDAQ